MAEKQEKKKDSQKDAAGAGPSAALLKKDDHGAGAAAKGGGGGGGGLLTKTPVMLGGVMMLEALVLFAGFKFLGGNGPKGASGAELVAAEQASGGHGSEAHDGEHGSKGSGGISDPNKTLEVNVLDFKAPNKQTGRTFLYDVSIFAVAKGEKAEKVKQAVKDREALIKDRIRTIIAQSDPEKLGGGSEPGLETLRRQVKYQLDEIVGEGMIEEVLIPRCIPFRADY